MTQTQKTIVTGNIKVDDKSVVFLNATVSDGVMENITQNIQDKTLYAANKSAIETKITQFKNSLGNQS
ncbi:MAG: hypothetical protein IKE58_10100 [Blautia sp.]|nr:hypothetical protein [Blautia sp.]